MYYVTLCKYFPSIYGCNYLVLCINYRNQISRIVFVIRIEVKKSFEDEKENKRKEEKASGKLKRVEWNFVSRMILDGYMLNQSNWPGGKKRGRDEWRGKEGV